MSADRFDPSTTDEITEGLKSRLKNKIDGLTNFKETGFNYVFIRAFSGWLHDYKVAQAANWMSGYVDYVGGPVTQSDLDEFGIDFATPEEINEHLDDSDLDEFAKAYGVTRSPGTKATGHVTFTVSDSSVEVPRDTTVATRPDSEGNYYAFTTDETVSPDTGTEVSAPVTAEEVGDEYNTGAGTIEYLPNPPSGVQGVTNTQATSGGQGKETNDEFRERVKSSVQSSGQGGTVDGISGFIQKEIDQVGTGDVYVDEFYTGGSKQSSPYADVVVDGGEDSAVEDVINRARPVSIRHYLVRPTAYTFNVDLAVSGTNVDTNRVGDEVGSYIDSLTLGEDVSRDRIVQYAMNADENIAGIDTLTVSISNEPHDYVSGTSVYNLSKGSSMESDGISFVEDENGNTYTEGTDFEEIDDSGGGAPDSIDWSIGGSNPADGTTFYVTYNLQDDCPITEREKAVRGVINVSES